MCDGPLSSCATAGWGASRSMASLSTAPPLPPMGSAMPRCVFYLARQIKKKVGEPKKKLWWRERAAAERGGWGTRGMGGGGGCAGQVGVCARWVFLSFPFAERRKMGPENYGRTRTKDRKKEFASSFPSKGPQTAAPRGRSGENGVEKGERRGGESGGRQSRIKDARMRFFFKPF